MNKNLNWFVYIILASVFISMGCNLFNIRGDGLAPSQSILPTNTAIVSPLVGRDPVQWFSRNQFPIFDSTKFVGNFAYLNKDVAETQVNYQEYLDFLNRTGRIVSYGYFWREDDCTTAKPEAVTLGRISAVLYRDEMSAQAGLDSYIKDYQNNPNLFLREDVNIGNDAIIVQYEYPDCATAVLATQMVFRRYNVMVSVYIETFQIESKSKIYDAALKIGSQIDQLIIDEAYDHPGTPAEISEIVNTAQTIKLPSDLTPSSANSSDDPMQYIKSSFTCYGGSYSYDLVGDVENTGSKSIDITVLWQVDPVWYDGAGGKSSGVVTVLPGEFKTIYLHGVDWVYDSTGHEIRDCIVSSVTAEWSAP